MSSGETLSAPIAHMSDRERALTNVTPPASPVTLCQVIPRRCQVPMPGYAPGPPNTQTSDGLNAVTSVIWVASWCSGHVLATDQDVPFQCSAYPVSWLTAQASFGAGALTEISVPVSPLGRVAACQRVPVQCSASGAPGVLPDRSVPPTAQALALPDAATLNRPLKSAGVP